MVAPAVSAQIGTIVPIVVHLSGTHTASVANAAKFRVPQACRVVRVAATAQAKGGTQGTSTLQVQQGASTNLLSAAIDLATPAADTWTEGTLAKANTNDLGVRLEKETEVTVDLVISGGASPTLSHITVQIDIVPED